MSLTCSETPEGRLAALLQNTSQKRCCRRKHNLKIDKDQIKLNLDTLLHQPTESNRSGPAVLFPDRQQGSIPSSTPTTTIQPPAGQETILRCLHSRRFLPVLYDSVRLGSTDPGEEELQLTGADPPADQFPQHAGRHSDRQTGGPRLLRRPHTPPTPEQRREGRREAGLPRLLSGSMSFKTTLLCLRPLIPFSRQRMEEVEDRGWRGGERSRPIRGGGRGQSGDKPQRSVEVERVGGVRSDESGGGSSSSV